MKSKILSIGTREYSGPVYNLELEPIHEELDDQYYVCADTGLVIHNCHPRDNIALRWLAQDLDLGYDLFHSIMTSRDRQAKHIAERLIKLSQESNLPIVIHGRAYKPYVPYRDGSYSELIAYYIAEARIEVNWSDPLTGDIWCGDPAVILLAHNGEVTYGEVNGIRKNRSQYYFDIAPGSIILDPWRTTPPMENIRVIHYGNTRNKK